MNTTVDEHEMVGGVGALFAHLALRASRRRHIRMIEAALNAMRGRPFLDALERWVECRFFTTFDSHPQGRSLIARAVGVEGNLPFLFKQLFLTVDYAATDATSSAHGATGDLSAWLYMFASVLVEKIYFYRELPTLLAACDQRGLPTVTLHFHPIGAGADNDVILTQSYIDGRVEQPFFAMLHAFAKEFLSEKPAPIAFYLGFKVDVAALREYRLGGTFAALQPE